MLRRLFGLVLLLVVVGVALYLWRGRPVGSPDLIEPAGPNKGIRSVNRSYSCFTRPIWPTALRSRFCRRFGRESSC